MGDRDMMSGCITTHILDLAQGLPAGGIEVELWRLVPQREPYRVCKCRTGPDGRPPQPLSEGHAIETGEYEIVLHTKAYYAATGGLFSAETIFPVARVRFHVNDPSQHYHIPVLITPSSFTAYRGS
ncbi:hydroxyisourate hydrolase [Alicyclobacillus mali (ex Roth et al. 2021)]|uniref:hydroxyisourate hydrolase n=1 Tax=Alicyclobacillus mali (ex Roth et al. 2021) TaxID=1123961 RepID=UPI003D6C9B88